jgi:hypothetical protein
MSKEKVTSLTKDEVREILSQAFEAQGSQNFNNLPVAIFQAWACKVKAKAFDEFRGECEKSASEFRAEVEKSVNEYKAEVEKAAEKFDNEMNTHFMKYMK